MRLFWSHVTDHKFRGLTHVNSGQFFLFFFSNLSVFVIYYIIKSTEVIESNKINNLIFKFLLFF